MRKIIIGGAAAALGVSTLLASGASAGGNGAAVSPLSPQQGSALSGQCVEGDGSGGNGFVMLNAPGQPGNASKLIGEVSLKNAVPGTYMVEVSVGSNNCMPEGTLTTNAVGNGNAHIADPTLGSGSFYVVLVDSSGNEQYASQSVTVN